MSVSSHLKATTYLGSNTDERVEVQNGEARLEAVALGSVHERHVDEHERVQNSKDERRAGVLTEPRHGGERRLGNVEAEKRGEW